MSVISSGHELAWHVKLVSILPLMIKTGSSGVTSFIIIYCAIVQAQSSDDDTGAIQPNDNGLAVTTGPGPQVSPDTA